MVRIFRDKDGQLRLELPHWPGGLKATLAQLVCAEFLSAFGNYLKEHEGFFTQDEQDSVENVLELIDSPVEELFEKAIPKPEAATE